MANKNISQLTAASTVNSNDLFVLEQGGVAKKLTGTLLLATIEAHGGIANASYTPPVAPSLVGTLTLTYSDGTSSNVPIHNGANGEAGPAGFSPYVSELSKDGNTTTLTITDANGGHTTQIYDGEVGPAGNPGYCWIKWAANEPTSDADLSDSPNDWMGVYSGDASTAPTDYTLYEWYRIKGDVGATGERGSYIWMATNEGYDVGSKHYFLKTALVQPGNLTNATVQKGDIILYGDLYWYATGFSTQTAYEATAMHQFNNASVPAGGSKGSRLVKASGNDFDVDWDTPEVSFVTREWDATGIVQAAQDFDKTVILREINDSVVEHGIKSFNYYPLATARCEYSSTGDLPRLLRSTAVFTRAEANGNIFWVTATGAQLGETTWTQGTITPGGGEPYSSNPSMDGVASAGTSTAYARGDHVHPSDTSKYTKPSSGIPKSDLASAVQTSLGKADTALQSAPVTSVNNQTGAVVLTASDVGAGTYSKPTTGIPAADLASAVQTSLGKADTALQQHQDISGKQDKNMGSGNAGKFLVVGSDGNITTVAMTAWQGGSY